MSTTNLKPFHILVAVDGSEHALAGVQAVRDMQLPPGSHITILCAFLPRNASNLKTYETYAHQAAEILVDTPFPVNEEVLAGIPAEVINQVAIDQQVDLIVMGAKGLRATMGIMLGGVAQQVVEYADRPVLIMRAPYQHIHHILFTTDGSQCSNAAMEYIPFLPFPNLAQVDILHILPPPPIPQSIVAAQAWPIVYETGAALEAEEKAEIATLLQEEEKQGKELLEKNLNAIKYGFAEHNIHPNITTHLLRGDAATEILAYLHDHPVDLIISGSRGLSAVRSWLLGSVSRKLLHYAGISVLVVRGLPPCTK
jgi:nucleotide-binding universal stress UspA family protein